MEKQSYNDYLMHYGIQGMKWGVMNGPPYPLTPKQASKEERKHNKRLAKDFQKRLSGAQYELRSAQIKEAKNTKKLVKADKKFLTERIKKDGSAFTIPVGDDGKPITLVKKEDEEKFKNDTRKYRQNINEARTRINSARKEVADILQEIGETPINVMAISRIHSIGGEYLAARSKNTLVSAALNGQVLNAWQEGVEDNGSPVWGDTYYVVNAPGKSYYKAKYGDQNKNKASETIPENSKKSSALPSNVQSEIWKAVAAKAEREGITSVGADTVNEVAKKLSEDKSSEYYKYIHSKE